jgi:hypothetical protein
MSLFRALRLAFALAAPLAAVVACQAAEDDTDDSSADLDATSLVCSAPPVARSYVFFDGTKLEDKRADESVDANRARFKPFVVMADEYKRVLGTVPKSLASSAATFADPPARWFAEPEPSGVTLNAIYGIGLDGCSTMLAGDASKTTPPAADTAGAFCKDLMTKAWGQAPADDELAACVDLLTNKLSGESDARTRWAHGCATVLTTTQFLTY